MPLPLRPFRHRGVLVALWLAFAVQYLYARQPGFWRSPYLRYETARTLADQGRDTEALDEMDRAIFDDPSNAGYLTFKGYLETRAGRAEAAIQSFSRALALRGGDNDIRLGLAAADVRLGRNAEAREVLAALPSQTLTLEQRFRRQSLYAQMQEFTLALGDTALLDTDLRDAERLREGLRWALGAQAWDRALTLVGRVVAATEDANMRQEALESKAMALDALGRSAEALAAYNDVPSAANLETRARLASQLMRHGQAGDLFRELLAQRPDDAEVARNLAMSLSSAGRLREAIVAYRSTLEATDDPDLRLQLVALLNATKDHDKAWKTLSAFKRPSSDSRVLRVQLRTAVWSGRLTDAAGLLEHVSPLSPEEVTLAGDLALSLTKDNQGPAGERVYRRLLDEGRATTEVRERYAWWLTDGRRYADAWAVIGPVGRAELSQRGRELQAWSAFWAANYEAASPMLADLARDNPSRADAWRDLAEAARQLKDVQTELRALDAYVGLNAKDVEAGSRRASLLDRAGRTATALAAYSAVLAQSPGRIETRKDYARLLERNGRIPDAVREYETVWNAEAKRPGTAQANTDLALVIARLLRSSRRPSDALLWYGRGTGDSGSALPSKLAIEVAQTEIDAGRADAAHKRMDAVVRAGANDPELLAFAANAAAAAGNHAGAAAHLDALASQRPLSAQELQWQAGLYRTSGDLQRALTVYQRMVDSRIDEAVALSAMGDVYFEQHELLKAHDAWTRARAGRTSPSVTLKLARLTAALGRMTEALGEYERYLQTDSPDGLRVEMARAYLGAERFDKAERWAREATESGQERGIAADLVLAQALHLTGKVRESHALNNGRPKADQNTPELLELYAQLAAARNQHLRAVRLFDQAIERGAQRQGELWMWSARSAYKRDDFFRSTGRLARSSTGGFEPPFAPHVRADLDTAVAPIVAIPTRVFGDSNDVRLAQTGVRGQMFPDRRFELSGELTYGDLSQRGNGYRRTRAVAGVSRALVTPTVGINASIGAEHYDRGGTLAVGRAGATKYFIDNSSVGVSGYRESMWSDHDVRDPRQFNRVVDLARLGPAFHIQGVSATIDRRQGPVQQSLVEVGAERFQDDTTHPYAYGHYQFVLRDRPGAWTAVRPNVYWEHFSQRSPLYFSPDQFVSIGSMWHEIRGQGPWRVEAEVNPKMTLFDSQTGFAFHGLLDASREVGPASVGGGAFLLYDNRTNYWAWRLAAQVGLRIGR